MGERDFILHYNRLWVKLIPGKIKFSDFRGGTQSSLVIDGDEMCYLDMLKEIKIHIEDAPVSCVKYISRGHLCSFKSDSEMLSMWDLIRAERDMKQHLFVSMIIVDITRPSPVHVHLSPLTNEPHKIPSKKPTLPSCPSPSTLKLATNVHELRRSPRFVSIPTTPKSMTTHTEVRKSITTHTSPAPPKNNFELRKSPKLNHVRVQPVSEARVEEHVDVDHVSTQGEEIVDYGMAFEDLFDNEVEEFDAGVSEDDKVDRVLEVRHTFGPHALIQNGYISAASSDSEDEKFILNDDESDSGNDVVPELVHSEDDVSDDEVRSFVKMAKNQYEAEDNERNDGPKNAVVGMQLVVRWRVFCSLSGKHTFKLRTFVPTHTCEADETNKYDQAKTPWVVDKLEEYMIAHPNLSPKDLMAQVLYEFGVVISYWTAWRSRYCNPYYHVNAFRATYAGWIFPFDNVDEWGKVMPGDEVLPPSIERKAGRPRKQRIRGDDKERATSKRKCRKCKEPGHNSRTCHHGKSGKNGKKQKNTSDYNEIEGGVEAKGENMEPIVDVQQQQEDTQVHNVDDIPRATRGGRRSRWKSKCQCGPTTK
ncbi:hypothetical protein IFM89_004023 [Coptis chinensis]|uniref:CCHC-type domain-containing protein n=1 Tax=Coptis chinensis TaxID=261450 RepID=A0A835GW38_9MAGN|nr:hypothetical protein IFM89_004023 [Coptis chinensis]